MRHVGMVTPEIVLTNSHDRGSSFILELGLFRLVCLNGMVVNSGKLEGYRVRHVGSTVENILDAVQSLTRQFPVVAEQVERFRSVTLSDDQRLNLAALAMGLRYDEAKQPFPSARLLTVRRQADIGNDLWSTFNVIQENLLQGVHLRRYEKRVHVVNGHAGQSMRAVKSIDVDLQLNRGLWQLAEVAAMATA